MGVPVKKSGSSKKKNKGGASAPQRTAEDYYEEAEIAFMSDDLDTARSAYAKALEMEPENLEYLDAYGSFLAECGPRDEAVSVLQRACALEPDSGFEKYMYLGQVLDQDSQSAAAQVALRKGIEILRQELAHAEEQAKAIDEHLASKDNNNADDLGDLDEGFPQPEALKEALSSALCSLAELLLGVASDPEAGNDTNNTALMSAEAALEESEQILNEAKDLYPASPEPLQALCSMRRLQDREEEALALLKQSMALWFKIRPTDDVEEEEDLHKADDAGKDGDTDESSEGMDLEGHELPSYEFRFETAKLLLELDETTESAIQVLEGLLEENDAVPHVWLLLAVAYRAGGDLEEAAEAVDEGLQVVKAMRLPDDDDMVVALNELKGELDSIGGGDNGGGEEKK